MIKHYTMKKNNRREKRKRSLTVYDGGRERRYIYAYYVEIKYVKYKHTSIYMIYACYQHHQLVVMSTRNVDKKKKINISVYY